MNHNYFISTFRPDRFNSSEDHLRKGELLGVAELVGSGRTEAFRAIFGTLTLFGVPIIFVMGLAIVIIANIILKKSVFGRMIYAIGNNEEAVRLSGHRTILFKITAYIICGGRVGIASIMYMLRFNIFSPILGVGFELNAIAAVVIGGTSMIGGKGSLIGTFLGAAIIGVLNNGLLLLGMGDFARQIV